jgi:NADH-quinone oxidoreductase subunit J
MNPQFLVLLVLMVAASVYTVVAGEILFSAIGLALVSALLSCVLFLMDLPLAGTFELSVCAGLITVVFIAAISLTRPDHERTQDALARARRGRLLSLASLVGLMAVLSAVFYGTPVVFNFPEVASPPSVDVRTMMWTVRRFDIVGQIAAILTGVFAVVVLFKSREPEPDRVNKKPRK